MTTVDLLRGGVTVSSGDRGVGGDLPCQLAKMKELQLEHGTSALQYPQKIFRIHQQTVYHLEGEEGGVGSRKRRRRRIEEEKEESLVCLPVKTALEVLSSLSTK